VTLRRYFPTLIRFENMLRGRILLRVLLAFVVLIFAMTTIVRIHSFVLTRRMERVIAGLSKLQIDQSTEEDVKLAMPQLVRWQSDGQLERSHETGDIDVGIEKGYSVSISNESGWMKFGGLISPITSCCVNTTHTKDGYEHNWILALANLLGYRYVNFSASVVLLNGRVSSISYGIQDRLVFPRQAGTIVGVKSAHSFWAPYRTGFEVSSMDDESPQFRVSKGEHNLGVSYTTDAPSELKAHAFQIWLTCFWGLRGCSTPRQIAPLLSEDAERIQQDAVARLGSTDPCPARIVLGRSRYLADMSVSLIESEGLRQEPANMEGSLGARTVTDYKLIEVLRGFPAQSLKSLEARPTVPFPGDYAKQLPNFGPQWPERGKQILLFSNHHFDSCQLVPAVPEAIAAVRNTPLAPRRSEDEGVSSLQ